VPNFALAAFYEVGSVRLHGAQQSLSTGGRWLRTAQRLKRGGRGRAPRIGLHRWASSLPVAPPPDARALFAP
jgi:hypothetical protein